MYNPGCNGYYFLILHCRAIYVQCQCFIFSANVQCQYFNEQKTLVINMKYNQIRNELSLEYDMWTSPSLSSHHQYLIKLFKSYIQVNNLTIMKHVECPNFGKVTSRGPFDLLLSVFQMWWPLPQYRLWLNILEAYWSPTPFTIINPPSLFSSTELSPIYCKMLC